MFDYTLDRENNRIYLMTSSPVQLIEETIEEFGKQLYIEKHWHSKYNDYIVYDYEPFCIDGFKIEYKIEANEKELVRLNFLYWRLQRVLNNLTYLEVLCT